MGIVDPVFVEGPAYAFLDGFAVIPEGLETEKGRPQGFPLGGGEFAVGEHLFYPLPGKGKLHGPSLINMGRIVDSPLNLYRGLKTGEVIVHKGPPFSPVVSAVPEGILESAQDIHISGIEIEFRGIKTAPLFQRILVNKENLVYSIKGVYLKFIITVFPIQKDLHIVIKPDKGIPFRKACPDRGFLNPKGDIEIFIVP
jgi:hypothetical protein